MFEENNQVIETENTETQAVEETVGAAVAEETVKTYTQDEFDAAMQKRLARQEAKLRREYDEKYAVHREAEEVLKAGMQTSDIVEATNQLREFYESKGVEIPKHQVPTYSDEDTRVLATHEANKIIDFGIEAVVEEVDRLAAKGLENMTPKEKLMFNQLAAHRQSDIDKNELAKIGVKETALQDPEFIEFANDLNPKLTTAEKYQKFLKYNKPKPQIETIGSMRQSGIKDDGVKDFYTREEALKFTKADFDRNPALFKAVERSMPKW